MEHKELTEDLDLFIVGMQVLATSLTTGKRSDGPIALAKALQADLRQLGIAFVKIDAVKQ